jgi:hypothetical protein
MTLRRAAFQELEGQTMSHRGAMKNEPEPEPEETAAGERLPGAAGDVPHEREGRGATGGMSGGEYEVPPDLDAGTGRQAGPGTGWGMTSGNPTGYGQPGQPGTTSGASGGEAAPGGER